MTYRRAAIAAPGLALFTAPMIHLTRRDLILRCAVATVAPFAIAKPVPMQRRRVEKVFRAPEAHPNALAATPEGLWCADQVSEAASLLDWNTGLLLRSIQTDSSNTSGIAIGGGFLWMGANGSAPLRQPRPGDSTAPRIIKVDSATGSKLREFPSPDGGSIRGLLYAHDSLWVTSPSSNNVNQLDPETMRIKHRFPLLFPRAHGLASDPPDIWVVYQDSRLFLKQDIRTGKVLQSLSIQVGLDPVPHGIAAHNGGIYFCDAGLRANDVGDFPDLSPTAGWISRISIR